MAKPAPRAPTAAAAPTTNDNDSIAKARTLVESYTFKELQRELKSRELRAMGKKQELKARLEGALVAELEALEEAVVAAPTEEAANARKLPPKKKKTKRRFGTDCSFGARCERPCCEPKTTGTHPDFLAAVPTEVVTAPSPAPAPRALYGPVRWPQGKPRDETSRPVAGATLVAARQQGLVNPAYSGTDRFPLKPWCKNNGVEHLAVQRLGTYGGSVEACVRQSPRLDLEGDRALSILGAGPQYVKGHFISIVEEARIALAAGRVPHGAVEYVQWWSGSTQYVEGRAPMARMPDLLPEDALRLVYEHLVPMERYEATAQIEGARTLLYGSDSQSDDDGGTDADENVALAPPQPDTVILVEGELVSDSEAVSNYDGSRDESDDEEDSSGDDEDDESEEELDLDELNERHEELEEVISALNSVDETLMMEMWSTRGFSEISSHWRAALRRTLLIHRGRHQEYCAFVDALTEVKESTDERRRDLGYESDDYHGGG